MLAGIDRYLIRSFLGIFLGLIGVAMALLLLERLIRIAELVAGSDSAMLSGSILVANLIPHYLNLALPGAFLISMILTIDRLSRSGEIVAIMAAGVSLYRIVLPFIWLSVILAVLSLMVSGFLQPLSRYSYRAMVHNLHHTSLIAVFQERKFVQYDNKIIWTESVDDTGYQLGPTFILETAANGTRTFLTSKAGVLREMKNGVWEIKLQNGNGASFSPNALPDQFEQIDFDEVRWPALSAADRYRPRGGDERELLLTELLNPSGDDALKGVSPVAAAASFHDRLSRAALLIVMPLVGILLGLNLGRNPQSLSAVLGVLFLLGVQKALEFGLAQAGAGTIPTWTGFWPLVAIVGGAAAYMFFRTAEGALIGERKRKPSAEAPRVAGLEQAPQ